MEEEVGYILSNNTNYTDDTIRSLNYAQEAIVLIICIIGIISDAFIIYIVAANKKMQSRTNILILNLAINDALYLIGTPAFITGILVLIGVMPSRTLGCFANNLDAISQFASWLMIAAIISDTLIKTKKISTRMLLGIIYSIIFILLIMTTILCVLQTDIPILYLIAGLAVIIITFAMFCKEIAKCCRKKASGERSMVRMNIGRIFVYVWFSTCVLVLVAHPFFVSNIFAAIFEYIFILGYLCPMYILIYLACADKFFKLCLLNIFRRKENKYNIDATITFADECDETGFENPAVNISFNGPDRNNAAL